MKMGGGDDTVLATLGIGQRRRGAKAGLFRVCLGCLGRRCQPSLRSLPQFTSANSRPLIPACCSLNLKPWHDLLDDFLHTWMPIIWHLSVCLVLYHACLAILLTPVITIAASLCKDARWRHGLT